MNGPENDGTELVEIEGDPFINLEPSHNGILK
jgi:hypothetical protein